jgi:hypothetical protein
MKTLNIIQLIDHLNNFDPVCECYPYEGEVHGFVVVKPSGDGEYEQVGFIPTETSKTIMQ